MKISLKISLWTLVPEDVQKTAHIFGTSSNIRCDRSGYHSSQKRLILNMIYKWIYTMEMQEKTDLIMKETVKCMIAIYLPLTAPTIRSRLLPNANTALRSCGATFLIEAFRKWQSNHGTQWKFHIMTQTLYCSSIWPEVKYRRSIW